MLSKSEWIEMEFDHPLLEDMEVSRVVYQGALGEPEQIQMWIYSRHHRAEMMTELLGKTLLFRLIDSDNTLYFKHWLSEIKWLIGKELAGRQHYVLTWKSPVAKIAQNNLSLVLQQVNLREAFRLILSGNLISKNPLTLQAHDLQVAGDIDTLQPPLKAQQESLMDFFKRLLAVNGLTYFFDHSRTECPLVITDSIENAGQNIDVAEYRYAEGDLLTKPFIERFKTHYAATSALFEVSGHPDRDPQILLENNQKAAEGFASFHAYFGERNVTETADYAKWVSEAATGKSERSSYSGGGIVFAGQIMQTQQQFLIASAWILELDGAMKNRIKQIQTSMHAQALEHAYREEMDLHPKQMLMAGHTIAQNNVSVDAMGHYQVNVPPYFIQNKPQSLAATRMLYPLQSDDHGQHYTLMPNAEALSLWWGNNANQSLILGTVNSTESPHLTHQETYQNAYWQDNSGNRVGFINEGKYDPTQKTGRKTAHILETPAYHPDGSSNYLRMGDAVQNDGAYASQAGEPGMLAVTEGNYHEDHHGGLMELMGNMGTDQNNPVPALRQRVQVNPSLGAPHVLKTVSAHRHTADLTSDQVTENMTLDDDTLTHTLTAPDYFLTHGQDETRSIYVNQAHTQKGQSNVTNINTHALFTTAQERTLKQEGTQRTDQYQNKNLNLNHPQNNLQYETLTQNTTNLNKQTTTEITNIQDYTRTHQQSMQQASQITQQNNSLQSNVGKSYFGDSMHLESGSGSPLPPDSAVMLNDAGMKGIQDEQEQKKKEIVFLLDDPDQLTQGKLRLSVNQQKPMALPLNSPCIYSLDATQKQGAIELLRRENPDSPRVSLATFHPQIRDIQVQYQAPPETQLPKSWFTPSGKLPAYMGLQKVPNSPGLNINDSDINVVMLAVDVAPPQECQATGGYQVNSASDETVSWLMQSLYTVNKTLPKADATEGWHWESPSISDIGLVFKDGVNALAVKDNRQFLMEFLHGGKFHIKEVKGQWMLVFYGKAGLRKWVTGTTYSLEGEASEKNKIRIFKSYAKLMDKENRFSKVAILAEDAADDSPLAIIVIAPLDTVQYFLDKDPNKQISDLFVNIGIDVVNAAVAGMIVTGILVLLAAPLALTAGVIVIAGIGGAFLAGWVLKNVENKIGLTNVLIGLGRKVEDHFIAQGDQLQIDFKTFSNDSATALTKAEAINDAAVTMTKAMSEAP